MVHSSVKCPKTISITFLFSFISCFSIYIFMRKLQASIEWYTVQILTVCIVLHNVFCQIQLTSVRYMRSLLLADLQTIFHSFCSYRLCGWQTTYLHDLHQRNANNINSINYSKMTIVLNIFMLSLRKITSFAFKFFTLLWARPLTANIKYIWKIITIRKTVNKTLMRPKWLPKPKMKRRAPQLSFIIKQELKVDVEVLIEKFVSREKLILVNHLILLRKIRCMYSEWNSQLSTNFDLLKPDFVLSGVFVPLRTQGKNLVWDEQFIIDELYIKLIPL